MVSNLSFEVLLGLAPHYGQNSQLLSKNYDAFLPYKLIGFKHIKLFTILFLIISNQILVIIRILTHTSLIITRRRQVNFLEILEVSGHSECGLGCLGHIFRDQGQKGGVWCGNRDIL